MRILPVIRLSLVTENTTSPERQLEKITQYAQLAEHELVLVTEADYDLDVSGAVSPFDRPGLGRWLQDDRLDMWDALCAAKLDRISRSLFDFTALLHWLEAHGKTLIILDPMLDLTRPEGRVMANTLMSFAAYEREVIGARVKDAYDKLVRDGKYTGGMVPFGYRPVKLARNWGYEVDPVYGPVVAEMCTRYLNGETLGGITRWLRDSGIPSPKNVIRQRNGKPLTDTPWSTTVVRMIMSSPAIRGAVVDTRGKLLRDADGVVVYRADPLVSLEVYEGVQARLALNQAPVKVNSTPLLQVAFCTCGAPMHSTTTKRAGYEYRYYHCNSSHLRDGRCTARRMVAQPLEDAVFGSLLELAGHAELTEKKLIVGRDYSEDIARIGEQIGHLSSVVAIGQATRKDVSKEVGALERAQAEIRRLAAQEPVPARVEPVSMGKTFAEHWESLDTVGRNEFLRSVGVRAVASRDEMPQLDLPGSPTTVEDIPRSVIIDRDDLHVVIELGGLADLLERASAA
jgi:DNA invertase Pin-like site-specific DNA recombinase